MPFIRIYGIPREKWFIRFITSLFHIFGFNLKTPLVRKLENLIKALQERLERDKSEFKISRGATSIFFPPDLVQSGLGDEIIIDLLLRNKAERTPEVINATANAIVGTIRRHFPNVPLIECFPVIIPRETFAQSIADHSYP